MAPRTAGVPISDMTALGVWSPRAIFAHYDRIQVVGRTVLCVRVIDPDHERVWGVVGTVVATRADGEVLVRFGADPAAPAVMMRCAELEVVR